MRHMVFMAGKFEGAAASDLPGEDLFWLRRHATGIDRAIAVDELSRRAWADKQRRQNYERRNPGTRGRG